MFLGEGRGVAAPPEGCCYGLPGFFALLVGVSSAW